MISSAGSLSKSSDLINGRYQVSAARFGSRQCSAQFRVVQVELDPAQLRKFADLPKNDGGDAPRFIGEQSTFTRCQIAGQGIKQNACVSRFSIPLHAGA